MKGSDQIDRDSGMYLLLLELEKTEKIKPGRLEEVDYKKGMYIYVGKAHRGLKARIGRHIRREKKQFWHIDYLLRRAKIREIWAKENFFDECQTASAIRNFLPSPYPMHKGFGSSDCRCQGHLLPLSSTRRELKIFLRKQGFQKVAFDGNTL